MVLLESESVELKMSAQMIFKDWAHCAKTRMCWKGGIKKSFYIETTRLHEINTEEGKWKIRMNNGCIRT